LISSIYGYLSFFSHPAAYTSVPLYPLTKSFFIPFMSLSETGHLWGEPYVLFDHAVFLLLFRSLCPPVV
jgi:hypothetical protein